MSEPPYKRARYPSPPVGTKPQSNTFAHFALQSPSSYSPPTTAPTAFQLPLHLTSFSYSPTRKVLLGERKDESLSIYREPPLGAGVGLGRGYNECTWREETDEGLDALLDTLLSYMNTDTTPTARETISKSSVISWRGMLSKLLLAVYDVESSNAGGNGRKADGWELNGMVLDGTLYLEEAKSPSKIIQKTQSEAGQKLMSYYGYSFEAYCTEAPKPSSTSSQAQSHPASPTHSSMDTDQISADFTPPNTNIQWCSLVKTNLGGHRMILGGEVDCLVDQGGAAQDFGRERKVETKDFVELKTNIVIESERDESGFERYKLLKHYIQSFLLGVPLIIVGYRTRSGDLVGLQKFKTLEIPRLVRNKPNSWNPSACLAAGQQIISFLHSKISSHPSTQSHQAFLDSILPSTSTSTNEPEAEDIQTLSAWPVFRITFTPSQNSRDSPAAGISLRMLSGKEVEEEVISGKKKDERFGFLLRRWVEGSRKGRI